MNLPNQPIQTYTYNELGEVVMKSLGYVNPTTWLQNVNFRYSIRGQLLNINNSKLIDDDGVTSNDSNDLFGMQMLYDGSDGNLNGGHGNTALFDGRPSAVKWMSTDASGNKSYERSYVYNYDGIARYTGEIYSERTVTGTGHFSNNVDGFDESGITYDQNGNILTLQRNSSTQGTDSNTQIDNLTYAYSTTQPNQVSTVTDGAGIQYTGAGFRNLTGSTTPYVYDPNGNLTNDYYKGLQNGYNVLNRVDKCTVTTGTNQYINYIYDASGQLIRKQEYNNNVLGTTTDYIGGFVYLTQGTGTAALSYFARPEGRVLVNGSAFTQQFIITDGQGNARISFQNNGSSVAVVKQENSYYGFGLQLLNSPVSLPPKPNKQLYNGGSEWQNDYANGDTNLPDYYQTFYRNYDAAIGRFVGTDPNPESAESMTGYQYAGNMPIMMNDPDGSKTVPASYNYNYNYVSPLSPDNGPWQSMDAWADQQIEGAAAAASDEGLYYSNPDAYWAAYSASNGTFGGQNKTAQYFDEQGLSPTGQMEDGGRSDINGPAQGGGDSPSNTSGATGAAPVTPGGVTPVGNGYSVLLYEPSGPNVGDDNQGGFAAFYKQYVISGNISASDFDLNEKTGTVNWAVQTGGSYAFVAQVSFTRNGNAWILTTNLYYSGPKMDDLVTTTNTSLSLNNPQTGLLNNNLGFDQKNFDNTGSVFVLFGWSWIGQTSYNISNNSPDFYLNIHSSVAIYNSAGNSWGSAPAGISIPIFRSN